MEREQFFSLIDQVQERTRQEPVTELADAIVEAVAVAKQVEQGLASSEANESGRTERYER